MKEFSHVDKSATKAVLDLKTALDSTITVARNEWKYVADVERDFEDDLTVEAFASELNQVFLNMLVNAAHATELPGLDLSALSPELKERALQRLNEDSCPCGCRLTLAQCRINDAECGVSLPAAKRVVAEIEDTN